MSTPEPKTVRARRNARNILHKKCPPQNPQTYSTTFCAPAMTTSAFTTIHRHRVSGGASTTRASPDDASACLSRSRSALRRCSGTPRPGARWPSLLLGPLRPRLSSSNRLRRRRAHWPSLRPDPQRSEQRQTRSRRGPIPSPVVIATARLRLLGYRQMSSRWAGSSRLARSSWR